MHFLYYFQDEERLHPFPKTTLAEVYKLPDSCSAGGEGGGGGLPGLNLDEYIELI